MIDKDDNLPVLYNEIHSQSVSQLAAVKKIAIKAAGIAGQAAGNVKGVAATAGGKVSGAFGNIFRRKKDEGSNTGTDASVVICVNCKNEVAVGYKFCPACGQSIAT